MQYQSWSWKGSVSKLKKLIFFILFLIFSPLVQAAYVQHMTNNPSGAAVTDGATADFPMIAYMVANSEAIAQVPFTAYNGTWDKAQVYISQNDVGSAATCYLRINGGNSGVAVSITGSTTGLFQDTSNSGTSTAGQGVNWRLIVPAVAGTHTVTIKQGAVRFYSATNTFKRLQGHRSQNYSSTTTNYLNFGDASLIGQTTEAKYQFKTYTAGTLKDGYTRLAANTRDSATTLKSRINGADGTIAISITASTTGAFTDTVHTDAVAISDLIGMSVTGAAGSGTNQLDTWGYELETTSNKSLMYTQYDSYSASAGTTYYLTLEADTQVTSEAETQLKAQFAQTLSNLQIYVSANAASGAGTFCVRKGGADQAVTISIGAGTTGLLEDTTHSVSIAVNDLINTKITGGSGGATSFTSFGLMVEDTTPAVTVKNLATLGVG